MGRRPHPPLVGLVLALFALACQASPAAEGEAAPARSAAASGLDGVTIGGVEGFADPAEAGRAIAFAHELHAKVVRIEVPWAALEPLGPGRIEPRALAQADELVADAGADGLGVIMLVQRTPCWASSAPKALLRRCVPGSLRRANSWPPAHPAQFAAFVAYLASRYGARLTAIEVWNEPDQANQDYFAGPHKAARYAALLRAAYPAIKRANPTVEVLAGAIVGSNGEFLRALYKAGIKGYYNGLAVHFYTLTLAALSYIHGVQAAHGDATPLWLTEFGWSSCWPRRKLQQEQPCVTPQVQAANITNTFRALARMPYVASAVLYELRDAANEEFGVLSSGSQRKPAFAALAQVLASPRGSVSPTTLRLRRSRGRVLASGSAAVGDYMQLEAFKRGVLRYRALFTLNRFNRYSIALPSVLGTSGLRVRVYSYAGGPGSAAQAGV
ncbi:MAG TPA: glycosyl hydrolase [Solirubrobacteraceae bacterium]|nr:glycosyl hydrolase [Solirubrobacteraceae bacterium]